MEIETKVNWDGSTQPRPANTSYEASDYNQIADELEGAISQGSITPSELDTQQLKKSIVNMVVNAQFASSAYSLGVGEETYTLTPISPNTAPTVLRDGLSLKFRTSTTNTLTNVKILVSGLVAKDLVKFSGIGGGLVPLVISDISIDQIIEIVYIQSIDKFVYANKTSSVTIPDIADARLVIRTDLLGSGGFGNNFQSTAGYHRFVDRATGAVIANIQAGAITKTMGAWVAGNFNGGRYNGIPQQTDRLYYIYSILKNDGSVDLFAHPSYPDSNTPALNQTLIRPRVFVGAGASNRNDLTLSDLPAGYIASNLLGVAFYGTTTFLTETGRAIVPASGFGISDQGRYASRHQYYNFITPITLFNGSVLTTPITLAARAIPDFSVAVLNCSSKFTTNPGANIANLITIRSIGGNSTNGINTANLPTYLPTTRQDSELFYFRNANTYESTASVSIQKKINPNFLIGSNLYINLALRGAINIANDTVISLLGYYCDEVGSGGAEV